MHLHRLIPPDDLIRWTGSGSREAFVETGNAFFGYMKALAQLGPASRILDLGCGCGRLALPLFSFLNREGSYEGMDVDLRSIEWARENISAAYPNFRFHHADVHNTTYNAAGKVPPYRYRLPFPDRSFDVAVLASVFTHMLPQGLQNYLGELSRVMKTGGTCLMTFFLLNEDSSRQVRSGSSHFQFPHRFESCAVQSADNPESVIGYDETHAMRLLESHGLTLHAPIQYGYWSGRKSENYQDLVVARKVRSIPRIVQIVRRAKLYRYRAPHYVADPRFTAAA